MPRKLAEALDVQKQVAPESTKTRIWQAIMATAAATSTGKVAVLKRSVWWMAAAAVILVIGGLVAYQFLHTDLQLIKTAYGEKRTVSLPDGSQSSAKCQFTN